MVRYLKTFLLLMVLFHLSCCGSTSYQSRPEEEVPALPPYAGQRLRAYVVRFDIDKETLDKYPDLKEYRLGFGVCNRIVECLYQSGYFNLLEEKEDIKKRIHEEWKKRILTGEEPTEPKIPPAADFLIYAEAFDFSIQDCSTVSGLGGKQCYETTVGIQVRAIPIRGEGEYVPGSQRGSCTVEHKSSIWGGGQIDFDASCVGKATDVAVHKAIRQVFERLEAKGFLAGTTAVAGTIPAPASPKGSQPPPATPRISESQWLAVAVEEDLGDLPSARTAENTIIRELAKSGYGIVDLGRSQQARGEIDRILGSTTIPTQAVQKIGQALDCDYLIVGKAVADHVGTVDEVMVYEATLELRMIATSTAQVVGAFPPVKARGQGYEREWAIRRALDKAGEQAAREIPRGSGPPPATVVFLRNLSYGEAKGVTASLAKSLRTDTKLVYWSAALSEIAVKPSQTATTEAVLKQIQGFDSPPLKLEQRAGCKIVAVAGRKQAGGAISPDEKESQIEPGEINRLKDANVIVPKDGFKVGDLRIDPVDLPNIYPARLPNYALSFGRVTLQNLRKDKPLEDVRISLYVRDFMSVPSEAKIASLPSGGNREVPLRAIFDRDRLFENSQSRPVDAEITVGYHGQDSETKTFQVTVFGRNAMNWKDPDSLLNFMSYGGTEGPVRSFAAAALDGLNLRDVQPCMTNIYRANAIFTALASLPLSYVPDPNSNFNENTQDSVQFPRETLEKKNGDCDDMSVLFASCLESVGIPTRYLKTPDHIFVEFSTGMHERYWPDIYLQRDMFRFHKDGSLWVPLEVTEFCTESRCFMKAWANAADRCNRATLTEIPGSTQKSYPPFPLPEEAQNERPLPKDFQERRTESTFVFAREREASVQKEKERLRKRITANPGDVTAKNQLGVLLCRTGETPEAMEIFLSILKKNQSDLEARQNLANTYLLMQKPSEAIDEFRQIPQGKRDPEVLYNMAVAYVIEGDRKQAQGLLRQAADGIQLIPGEQEKEERKLAWMLGIGDTHHQVGSISDPLMGEFRDLVYEVMKREPPQVSPGGTQARWSLAELLWWKF